MKKIVSLILAVMMIASLTVTAFATTSDTTLEDKEGVTSTFKQENVNNGNVKTELWLQVDAQGQIDVTVPLVLVFKTDIDGGVATESNTYGITNSSTADLVVTKIATDAVDKNVAGADNDQPMELVEYTVGKTLLEDQYMVQLSVAADVEKGDDSTGAYDLKTAEHKNDAIKGGLFELKKPDANANEGKKTLIQADMATGKLSFVTSRTADDKLDEKMGVKLLTVTYTVAVDTNDAIGEEITNQNQSNS